MKTNFNDFLFEYVMGNKTLREIVKKQRVAPLYHAIEYKRAMEALIQNKLGGYSIQRYWEDGRRRKDDEDDYESGLYMRGLSLTRDVDYAKDWNDIIFVFDQEKLKNKWKILPYNWGYSIGGGYKQGSNAKREREEFLITGVSSTNNPRTKKPYKDKYKDHKSFDDMRKIPKGYVEPLDKYLIGFFISKHLIGFKEEKIEFFKKHTKYLGEY